MSESDFDGMRSAPRHLRICFLQEFFERSAKIRAEARLVVLPVTSLALLSVIRLLGDLDVHTHVFGTEPISVAVSVDDAARVPLFDQARSKKYKRVVALAANARDPRASEEEARARAPG
ncbi:MAG: hypothetical protein ABSF83_06425 [Nitrososphaerales archaeon]